jgi:hypothetical protein
MAEPARTADIPPDPEQAALEGGNYEIIRARLQAHGQALKEKADALNTRRQELFGGSELTVIGNSRVRTDNNCVPRDIVHVGGRLLLGFNVFLGLKTETAVRDVFSVYTFRETEDGFEFDPVNLADVVLIS